MIACKELNKSFDTKGEVIKALVENKAEIIALKKSAFKMSDGVSGTIKSTAEKAVSSEQLKFGDKVSVVINSIGILDSHNDVHITGMWNKSAKEKNGKVFHVVEHDLSIGKIVAYPNDVTVTVKNVTWAELGKSYEGSTEVLVFETTVTEKTNKDVFLAYRDGEDLQHSVRMEYVGLHLAINDTAEKDEYDNWLKFYPQIANKEVADERGYFWAVTEAKIIKEGSTVLFGSNDTTPILGRSTNQEPTKVTPDEPQPVSFGELLKQTNFLI